MPPLNLVRKFGVTEIFVNFFIELDFLKGRDKILNTISRFGLLFILTNREEESGYIDLIEDLKRVVSLLPELPGVYQYFNSEGKIIYVGKAKT